MTSREERRYIRRELSGREQVLKESAWQFGANGRRTLREDYGRHTKRFVPILDDIRRALKEFTSGEGGNMATLAELKELQRHPEAHAVIDTGCGDMIRSVLASGNTAINHLVWRKSQLVICQAVLFLLGMFELYQLFKLSAIDEMADLVAVAGTYAAGGCQLLCTSDEAVVQTGACADLCSSMVFHNESSRLGVSGNPCGDHTDLAEDPHTVLKRKMGQWSLIRHTVGMIAAFTCMLRFRRAGQTWTSILKSGDQTVKGWTLLFLSPLLMSFVPWFNVLHFSGAYDQGDVSNYQHVMGLLYGAQTKLQLGFSTYVTTYFIAVAVSKSALKAIVQCKLLVPRSSMLTIYFEALPMLNMILSWPLFVLVGTLVASGTIWVFLLFLALRPVAFTLFSPIAQHAKTPVQAHAVITRMKRVQNCFLLIAFSFILFDTASRSYEVVHHARSWNDLVELGTQNYAVALVAGALSQLNGSPSIILNVLVSAFPRGPAAKGAAFLCCLCFSLWFIQCR
eukprot:SAG22_NODE_1438_length_4419_cov_1.685880_3_plen_509_part_00